MRGRSAAVAQSHRRARYDAPAEPLLDRDDAPPYPSRFNDRQRALSIIKWGAGEASKNLGWQTQLE